MFLVTIRTTIDIIGGIGTGIATTITTETTTTGGDPGARQGVTTIMTAEEAEGDTAISVRSLIWFERRLLLLLSFNS